MRLWAERARGRAEPRGDGESAVHDAGSRRRRRGVFPAPLGLAPARLRHARMRLYRTAFAVERWLVVRSDLEQLRVGLGLVAVHAGVVGLTRLPLMPQADPVRLPALLLALIASGVILVVSRRPVIPAAVLTGGAIAAQTAYVVLTGHADSPFLSGFLVIVLVVALVSSPSRTLVAAVQAGIGLAVAAVLDQQAKPAVAIEVVMTFLVILVAGLTLSWLAWRRRVWLRHATRRASRAGAVAARRHAESRTDALTAHGNRRAFEEDLRARLAAVAPTAVGLVYADADNLKGLNDAFGHDAGDRMLRALADRFAASLRLRERVYRIGGDEFVAIVSADDLEGLVERLGTRLEVELEDVGTVSASLGAIQGRTPDTAADLLGRADRAMYRAKRGRPATAVRDR